METINGGCTDGSLSSKIGGRRHGDGKVILVKVDVIRLVGLFNEVTEVTKREALRCFSDIVEGSIGMLTEGTCLWTFCGLITKVGLRGGRRCKGLSKGGMGCRANDGLEMGKV